MLGIVSYSRYRSWGVLGSFSSRPPPPETISAPPVPTELAGIVKNKTRKNWEK